MARNPTVAVDIIADASKATAAFRDVGASADTAAASTGKFASGVEGVGGTAGQATTGLRDMSDAVAGLGFEKAAATMQVAAVGLESLDGAATLYSAATTVATTVTSGFSKAMNFLKVSILTNPIFIIAAIIIAIGAALVLAYMKCETFRNIVDAAFDVVQAAVSAVWDVIKALAGYVAGYFTTVFNTWKGIAKAAIDFLTNPVEKLLGFIQDIVDWIKRIKFPEPPGWMKSIGGAVGGIFGKSAPAPSMLATTRGGPVPMSGTRSSGLTINIQTTGLGASAPQIQDAIVEGLRRWSGRNGPLVDSRGAVGRYA